MRTATSRPGMTLLELIIATSILAVVMGAVFMALQQMTRGMSTEISNTVLNQETARSLEKMMEKLRSSWFHNLTDAGGPSLEYFVPVDADKDGDVLDATGRIDWGQDGPHGQKFDAVTVIRFVKTSTFDEKIRKFDLNRDGDLLDSFEIGHLEEAFYATSTVTGTPTDRRILTPDMVIQVAGKPVGDINADGEDDPIFIREDTLLRIRLFVTRSDDSQSPFEAFETSVSLRNW